MGLFGKKKKEGNLARPSSGNMPSLPELPKLPDFPHMENSDYSDMRDSEKIHKLPSFPSSSLGTKFSQDTIKEAVTGEEEDEGYADDFASEYDEDMQMMRPLKKPLTEEIGERGHGRTVSRSSPEPVFIRIDRFEDALRIFNETKRKVSEIEKVLGEIKQIKEKEGEELRAWENDMKIIKSEMEKVDADIFSKI